MDNKKWYVSSAIIAVGIMVLGFFIKSGIAGFTENSRVVTVKGLAEKEVKADKVIWPIVFKFISVPAKWIKTSRRHVLNIYSDNNAYANLFKTDFG